MDLGLRGRRALITGGTRGIGRAIAHRLAAEGVDVGVCARGEAGVQATLAELREAGVRAHGETVDVLDVAALEAAVGRAAEALGGLDLLVANAGGSTGGGIEEAGAQDWERTLALNVGHGAAATRAAVPALRAAGGGAVLLVASVSGLRPQPRAQYGVAKAGLIYLAEALGRELAGDGIRVNALSPGSILFEGGSWDRRRREQPDEYAAFVAAEFPFGRLGTLEEVADVAAFLLSPRAGWVSGTNVVVAGAQNPPSMTGYCARPSGGARRGAPRPGSAPTGGPGLAAD